MKFPLFRIDVHTGTVDVLTPNGIVIATLNREDQQYIAQTVVAAHNLPPEAKTPGRKVDILFGEREPNRQLKLD